MKVFIAEPNPEYIKLFQDYGWEIAYSILDADLVQFTGGADVDPRYYGEKKHPRTYSNPDRDVREKDLFDILLRRGTPMTGICRGGQFLNVMSGGKMYQDVSGHGRSHDAYDVNTGEVVEVTSTHHQMMRPSEDGEVILVAHEAGHRCVWDEAAETFIEMEVNAFWDDIEAVYYRHTKSLCFQPHPEFAKKECKDLYFRYIHQYLGLQA